MKTLIFLLLKYGLLIALLILPFQCFFSLIYWKNFFLSPILYSFSLVFILGPLLLIVFNDNWRNPFFVLPFYVSFVFSISTPVYFIFLRKLLCFLGIAGVLLCLNRYKRPWTLLEVELYDTDFFTDFFEVNKFWRFSVLVIIALFLPLLWLCSIYVIHH
jgi:hypothetical protein